MTRSNRVIAQDFIKLAKADLESSQVLYRANFYPQAVYMLQQSIEKSTKSFGLACRLIERKDLRENIGHLSSRIFLGWNGITKNFVKLAFIPNNDGIIAAFDPEMLKMFEDCCNRPYNYRNLSIENLNDFINHCNNDEQLVKLSREILEENREYRDLVYQKSRESFNSLFPWMIDKNIEKDPLIDFSNSLLDLMLVSKALLILSTILQPHEAFTRYADIEKAELNPLNFYISSLPIIDKFPELSNIVERNIDRFATTYILEIDGKIRRKLNCSNRHSRCRSNEHNHNFRNLSYLYRLVSSHICGYRIVICMLLCLITC